VGYLKDPDQLRLLPGAAEAIRRLNQHGLLVLVVTNQSGIARGLLSLDDYHRTELRLDRLLDRAGARIDRHYFCPHLPELTGPCRCRKPGTLLYRQAAAEFDLELDRSWWIGDRLRDVVPAEALGGRGILLPGPTGDSDAGLDRFQRALNLSGAAEVILTETCPSGS
jgi:D-glycero-D-manno-heptose 1,7-bisphosphate phosphatase